MIDFGLIWQSLPALLNGAVVTLEIAFLACFLGLSGGVILGLIHAGHKAIPRALVTAYVTLIRGTPMLVQIIFIFYVLPQFGIDIDAFWTAVIAISMNSSAYVSQIIRSGIRSVSKGQIEAAYVLGLSKLQTTRYVVLPQAFRVVLPAIGNEFITLIKDSSLASIIGVMELSKQGSIIRSRTYDAFSILLIVAVIYLIITSAVSLVIRKLENRMGAHAHN